MVLFHCVCVHVDLIKSAFHHAKDYYDSLSSRRWKRVPFQSPRSGGTIVKNTNLIKKSINLSPWIQLPLTISNTATVRAAIVWPVEGNRDSWRCNDADGNLFNPLTSNFDIFFLRGKYNFRWEFTRFTCHRSPSEISFHKIRTPLQRLSK